MICQFLILLVCLWASTLFAANGYLVRTNGTTVLGAGGGSDGASGDGYYTSTNGTVLVYTTPPAPTGPTDIAGLAYYWNYADLTVGNNVSSWVDRIQGLDTHQGDA